MHAWTAYLRYLFLHGLREIGSLAPSHWWLAAMIWSMASYTLLQTLIHTHDLVVVHTVWMFCALGWAQFGMAAVFVALGKGDKELAYNRFLFTLLPPLTLHFVLFSIIL
ncbi:MAG: hypothetical protein HQL80_09700 [Magnetococcales bacterium]|nr:hypothetical protein [Magnetococcales bacterium]